MRVEDSPFSPGDSIAEKYEVIKLLGWGGHAFVYECRDRFLDQVVAMKVIVDASRAGADVLRRAREEARLLVRLSHQNVVAVRDAGEARSGMVYIVMEKLDGITLRALLRQRGQLPALEALGIARQIADGVAAAHALNVIHRDLKPDNVFVIGAQQAVKVLDFGIAKFMGHGVDTTQKQLLHGTVAYMSPEHVQGFGVTPRSDVYQLGTILFEMLTGINPCLVGVSEPTLKGLAWIQIARPTPDLKPFVPDVSPSMVWLVKQATAKDPTQRFASMAALRSAIDAVASEEQRRASGHATTVPAVAESFDTERTSSPPFEPPNPARVPARIWRPLAFGAVPLGMVLGVAGGLLLPYETRDAGAAPADARVERGAAPPLAEARKGDDPRKAPSAGTSTAPPADSTLALAPASAPSAPAASATAASSVARPRATAVSPPAVLRPRSASESSPAPVLNLPSSGLDDPSPRTKSRATTTSSPPAATASATGRRPFVE